MGVERQTRRPVQLSLFEQVGAQVRPVLAGGDGNESGRSGVQQALTAMEQQRALTLRLMEQVVGPANLKILNGSTNRDLLSAPSTTRRYNTKRNRRGT